MRLTSLSPDIVERILRGDEPEGISLRQLHKGLPYDEYREIGERLSEHPQMGYMARFDLAVAHVGEATISQERADFPAAQQSFTEA